ncbi:carboxypeptidase B-like [Battus philenor]|uniref:carboxypeptidase B-like n=1 Tax=Battus philenor TaxID=42288 RepID=UPI0035D10C6B
MKSLDTVGAINIWKEERSTMDVMVEGRKAAQVAELLDERCIPFAVAIGDVGPLLDQEKGCKPKSWKCPKTCMDWKNYHRLNVIYEFMDSLAEENPSLCTVCTIGRSAEGRDIRLLKISNGGCNNVGVWMDAAIHPREWISTAVLTYFANELVENFNGQPEFITNKDWYILPVVNPDGYEYTHTHDRMWRKNRARYGQCYGVDLNRNFSYGWGERNEEGSSEDPGNIFYRGPEPFSEPETTAIRATICGNDRKFKVFLSFHSYGEVIIFPWGYTGDPCPDYVQMLEAGTVMAKAIQAASGHTYKVGSTKDLMYYAAGTSTDWSYAVANIPYSYMIELRGKRHRFLLPKEEIICTAIEVLCGVTKLMEYIDRCSRVSSRRSSESCRVPSAHVCKTPRVISCRSSRSHSCRSSRCHSCRSSRSSCKSARSCRSPRSHSRCSSRSRGCDSSHSKCCKSPTKTCNFT